MRLVTIFHVVIKGLEEIFFSQWFRSNFAPLKCIKKYGQGNDTFRSNLVEPLSNFTWQD